MSYQKQNFANGEVLTASQLNHIEQGIVEVESSVEDKATKEELKNIIDPTLSLPGKAAEAKATGDAIRGVRDDLASEISRAETAEKANADNIAAEVARAQAAESALSTKITEETERAKAAEQANADGIAAEASRAKGEEQRLDTAITAETARAEQAEQALDTRTTALESCGFVVVNGKVCMKYVKS
jgi:hypothetical protein|nr:MAG TPA: hypothetical protein [Caudoviricetes sp.]